MPHHRMISPAKFGWRENPQTPLSLIAPLALPGPRFHANFCWSANTSRRKPSAQRMTPMMSCERAGADVSCVGRLSLLQGGTDGGCPEGDVAAAEAGVGGDGRVEDGDGEGDSPGPEHLEDEEAAEGDELALRSGKRAVRGGERSAHTLT